MKNDLSRMRLKIWIPFTLLTKSGLAKIIGFRNTIRLLKIFSFDKDWANYLINRENSSYYKISKIFFNKLSSNLKIIDIGMGVGQLLKEYKYPVTAVDRSSLNLFLAKYFFTKKNDILIEYDIEKKIPFSTNTFDLIHLNDTFQYIKNKTFFLKEAYRSLKSDGALFIVHTHQKNLYKKVKGIKLPNLITLLKRTGFKKINYFSDPLAFLKLYAEDSVTTKSETLKNDSEAYTIIASKNNHYNKSFNLATSPKEYVFVSPHLDDAILSSTNLMAKLRNSGNKVKIITVFTKASSKPFSPKALEHLQSSGYSDADKLFRDRKIEDINAINKLGVKYEHLDFTDAAFRKDLKGNFIYKEDELFSNVVSQKDNYLIKKIESKLRLHGSGKDKIFIGPLGLGGHVDHVIIHDIIQTLSSHPIYWEDCPYNLNPKNVQTFFHKNKNYNLLFQIDNDDSIKEKAIRMYKSQLRLLFPKKILTGLDERYYARYV